MPLLALSPAFMHIALTLRMKHDWSWSSFISNFTVSFPGYGSLVLLVPFLTLTIGARWSGLMMIVYAAAALLSTKLATSIPQRWHDSPRSWVLLGVAANLPWVLTGVIPFTGVLVSRVVSALTLFTAQGTADIQAQQADNSAAALAGRSLGSVMIGIFGSWLMTGITSVPIIAAIFAALGLLITWGYSLPRVRRMLSA
jgi:hypothetical protein